MKRVFYVVLLVVLAAGGSVAQTVRTGVLVMGDGNNAIGAAIQSAVSGAKTVVVLPGDGFELSPLGKGPQSGIAAEFLKRLKANQFDNAKANKVLKTWTDSLKNLTVIRNGSWLKLKRSGGGWSLELKDKRTIKAEVLVNADKSGKTDAALLLSKPAELWQSFGYGDNSYRTSIAASHDKDGQAEFLSLDRLMNPLQENLIALDPSKESFAAGQAGGATAAYAAFYKLKTSEAKLKVIQGELINYKLDLVPFTDVTLADSNWKAIQFIGLTGVLKAGLSADSVLFMPEQEVSTAEVKAVIKAYYYKAQIWFEDHIDPKLSIGSTLNLVCTVGNKALKSTEDEVKKNWKTAYHFKTEFDPKRNITRREFAVLVNEYLKPFNVNVDKTGRIVR